MTYSPTFRKLIERYKESSIEYPNLKPITLAMWIVDSNRGTSKLSDYLNFAGMKYRTEISHLAQKITYKEDFYCAFSSLERFIEAFWRFLDRAPYEGWRELSSDEAQFIRYIGAIWSGNLEYSERVLAIVDEAKSLLHEKKLPQPSTPEEKRSASAHVMTTLNDLEIINKSDANCPYGKSATRYKKPFEAVVVHHTSPRFDTLWYINYQIEGDSERGGHFGYHFYVSPEGIIYQGAPMDKRTNHVSSTAHRYSFGERAKNANAIGVVCASVNGAPTTKQFEQAYRLIQALCNKYQISSKNVFGHGEIQSNREANEGRALAKKIRHD